MATLAKNTYLILKARVLLWYYRRELLCLLLVNVLVWYSYSEVECTHTNPRLYVKTISELPADSTEIRYLGFEKLFKHYIRIWEDPVDGSYDERLGGSIWPTNHIHNRLLDPYVKSDTIALYRHVGRGYALDHLASLTGYPIKSNGQIEGNVFSLPNYMKDRLIETYNGGTLSATERFSLLCHINWYGHNSFSDYLRTIGKNSVVLANSTATETPFFKTGGTLYSPELPKGILPETATGYKVSDSRPCRDPFITNLSQRNLLSLRIEALNEAKVLLRGGPELNNLRLLDYYLSKDMVPKVQSSHMGLQALMPKIAEFIGEDGTNSVQYFESTKHMHLMSSFYLSDPLDRMRIFEPFIVRDVYSNEHPKRTGLLWTEFFHNHRPIPITEVVPYSAYKNKPVEVVCLNNPRFWSTAGISEQVPYGPHLTWGDGSESEEGLRVRTWVDVREGPLATGLSHPIRPNKSIMSVAGVNPTIGTSADRTITSLGVSDELGREFVWPKSGHWSQRVDNYWTRTGTPEITARGILLGSTNNFPWVPTYSLEKDGAVSPSVLGSSYELLYNPHPVSAVDYDEIEALSESKLQYKRHTIADTFQNEVGKEIRRIQINDIAKRAVSNPYPVNPVAENDAMEKTINAKLAFDKQALWEKLHQSKLSQGHRASSWSEYTTIENQEQLSGKYLRLLKR